MNTESVNCTRIRNLPLPADLKTKPGEFGWDTDMGCPEKDGLRFIYVHLPGGEGWDAIEVHRGNPLGDRVWGWDGDEDAPTLTPSILSHGVWHGYLTKGRLISC